MSRTVIIILIYHRHKHTDNIWICILEILSLNFGRDAGFYDRGIRGVPLSLKANAGTASVGP
jgi:hypothetical protein